MLYTFYFYLSFIFYFFYFCLLSQIVGATVLPSYQCANSIYPHCHLPEKYFALLCTANFSLGGYADDLYQVMGPGMLGSDYLHTFVVTVV